MNGPFVVAQANVAAGAAIKKPVRIVKVTKPSDGQAITVDLGYEQQTKLDLTAVANEKMTLVHIGEKLIFLFDNNATVTVELLSNRMMSFSPIWTRVIFSFETDVRSSLACCS